MQHSTSCLSILELNPDVLQLIFCALQKDDTAKNTKKDSRIKSSHVPAVSKNLLTLRLVCPMFRRIVNSMIMDVVVIRTSCMSNTYRKLHARMPHTTSSCRPFGLPRQRYTFVSHDTLAFEGLWSRAASKVRRYFESIRVYNRVHMGIAFMANRSDIFLSSRVHFDLVEFMPKDITYPFTYPNRPRAWSKVDTQLFMCHPSAKKVTIDKAIFLTGRKRTYLNNETKRDLFPSHIPAAKHIFVSEGAHSRQNSPSFSNLGVDLVEPIHPIGSNYMRVSEITRIFLTYIEIGNVEAFLNYFSGLKTITFCERVIGRTSLTEKIKRIRPDISFFSATGNL